MNGVRFHAIFLSGTVKRCRCPFHQKFAGKPAKKVRLSVYFSDNFVYNLQSVIFWLRWWNFCEQWFSAHSDTAAQGTGYQPEKGCRRPWHLAGAALSLRKRHTWMRFGLHCAHGGLLRGLLWLPAGQNTAPAGRKAACAGNGGGRYARWSPQREPKNNIELLTYCIWYSEKNQ